MRAPNAVEWVVLGFAGLGIYAVYRLSKATNVANETPILRPGQPPVPLPVPLPTGLNVPNKIVMGHIDVGRNTPVRGRVETTDPARTVSALQQLGFQNIRLYTLAEVQANPDLIPFPDALSNATAASRWFTATWVGTGQTRADVQLPREVVLLWYTFSETAPSPTPAPQALAFQPLASLASSQPALQRRFQAGFQPSFQTLLRGGFAG